MEWKFLEWHCQKKCDEKNTKYIWNYFNKVFAIANKIIPNTLLIILVPAGPINRWMKSTDFKTPNITTIFNAIAIIILINSNSARMEMMVVSVPAPANKGKARGTTEAVAVSASSLLNIRIPFY